MARIAGITLPSQKRIAVALTYIFGIGHSSATQILDDTGISPQVRVKDLDDQQVNSLRDVIEKKLKVEGELKREIMLNVKRMKEIGSYRGGRHSKGLPVRGQRTKTNSRSVRGNVRKTAASGKKQAAQKT